MTTESPTYQMFHRWLSKNRTRIAASRDKTVTYSGMEKGVHVWKKLPEHEKVIQTLLKYDPKWEPIEKVLKDLKVNWRTYSSEDVPPAVLALRNLWDFARTVEKIPGAVTTHEAQQIWKNLSANYARNAKGEIFIFAGDTLKKYPDLLLAEIPVLIKNKNVKYIADFERTLLRLIPKSRAAWEKFRKDSKEGREAGR